MKKNETNRRQRFDKNNNREASFYLKYYEEKRHIIVDSFHFPTAMY
jgi:hypothetical protein